MIATHQLNRFAPENADAVELAVIEQHLVKAGVIVKGRRETGSTHQQGWLFLETLLVGTCGAFDTSERLGRIQDRQTVPFFLRNEECRVVHTQRAKDPLLEELVERHSRENFDQPAQYID